MKNNKKTKRTNSNGKNSINSINNKKDMNKKTNKSISKNINSIRRTNEIHREYDNENEYNVFRNERNIRTNKKEKRNTLKKISKKSTNRTKNNIKKNRQINNERSKEIHNKESKKINNRGKLAIFCVLVISVFCMIVAGMLSPLFNVKEVTVIGNEKITEETIISLSGIQLEENIYKINKKYIKNNILENAYINDVKIKRKLPSTLEIIVEERKASFAIEYGGGYIYINNQGYILEISESKPELPILQGIITPSEKYILNNRLDVEDLNKLSTVIKIMEIAENIMIEEIDLNIASLISRLDIENSENYKMLIESQGKIVHLGNEMNLNDKLLRVAAIIGKTIGTSGEIFVNMDLTKQNPVFRENV